MSDFDATTTVGGCVTQSPQAARVFEELQIDYCCGGNRTLAEACGEKSIDVDALVARLTESAADAGDESPMDWMHAPAAELCDHIEQTHHAFLRRELPRLSDLIDKVVAAHAEHHPELRELRAVFGELRAELEPHMFKEEHVLFPAIRLLERPGSRPQFPFGTVANPIRMMEHEHDNAGSALKRIRELTNDYQPPPDACRTWHVLLDGLRQLEADTHQHVHKENNILFPRAQRLEASGVG